MKEYYVYMMANIARTIYIGVTNDLPRRVYEHKHGMIPGFTSKYRLTRLVYFEVGSDIQAAIEREKQLKGWVRRRKLELAESVNPKWDDLSAEWFDSSSSSSYGRAADSSSLPTSRQHPTPRSSE